MSTTITATLTSDTSAAATTSSSSSSDTSSTTNLYLFTFLSTLFLLVLISSAIVLRSFVLRRRLRRRIEEALAAGILLAPQTQGSHKKKFGARPVFYETWVSNGGYTWDEMMPVSAHPLSYPNSPKGADMSPKEQHESDNEHSPRHRPWLKWLGRSPSRRSPLSRGSSVNSLDSKEASHPDQTEPNCELQVSVLIAMPSPHRATHTSASLSDPEDEFPDVAIGVARSPYKLDQDPRD